MGFNRTVLIIATVILIIILTILAILLYNSHGALQFPPEVGQCPDYWTLKNGECHNTKALGNCGKTMNPNQWGKGKHARKEKCQWAKNCGLAWDGITNGSDC